MSLISIHLDIGTYPFSEDFKSVMRYMSAHCHSMSVGLNEQIAGPLVNGITGNLFDWFPNKPSIKKLLVLVLPKDIHDNYVSNPAHAKAEFTSGVVLKHTVGHCYISWDYSIGIVGLWDMCLHQQYLITSGYGSKALLSIIDSLIMKLPNYAVASANTNRDEKMVVKIWLCVDMSNVNFSNVIHLYTKYGFTTPIVEATDPFGNNWSTNFPNGLLGLSRNNEFIVDNDIDRDTGINDIIYTIQEAIGNYSLVQTGSMSSIIGSADVKKYDKYDKSYCNMSVKFDQENVTLLKRFSTGSSTMYIDGTFSQKEISGTFDIKSNIPYIIFPYIISPGMVPGQVITQYVGDPAIKPAMEILYQEVTAEYQRARAVYQTLSGSRVNKIKTIIDENYNNIRMNLGYVNIEIQEGQIPGVTYQYISQIPYTLSTVSSKVIVWELKVAIDTLIYGSEDTVTVPDTKYSFHTHPSAVYLKPFPVPMDKIIIGPAAPPRIVRAGHPSGRDYYGTLSKILIYKISFHTVVAPSGVYIISIHPYWLHNSDKLMKIFSNAYGSSAAIPKDFLNAWIKEATKRTNEANNIPLWMDEASTLYVVTNFSASWQDIITRMYDRYWGFVWDGLSIDDSCRRYAKICTETRPLGFDNEPLIKVQYRSWDELEKGDPITIEYKSIGRNCITTQTDTDTYNRFYPSAV